jgi:hypothetical protein
MDKLWDKDLTGVLERTRVRGMERKHKAQPVYGTEYDRGYDTALLAQCECGRTIVMVVYGEWDGEKAASYWRHK